MTDMEELLESVNDEQIKYFMKEAYLCYMASAYKACIIMSFISVYEDLRRKVKELSSINTEARGITSEIESRVKNNQVFESYLEEQLISNNILSANDGRNLKIIRDRRNLCAHPTSHKASAEEARYIYSLTIKNFLSKPVLKTIDRVNFIIDDLKNDNYFPSNFIDQISFMISPILKNIHINIYPYLIKELCRKIKEVKEENYNYRFFLSGLVQKSLLNKDLAKPLAENFISKRSNDSTFEKPIITALNINPVLYPLCTDNTKKRLKALIKKLLQTAENLPNTSLAHPIIFLSLLLDEKGEKYVLEDFQEEITELLDKSKYNPRTPLLASKLGVLKDDYIDSILDEAKSHNFNTANSFANNISNIEEKVISIMNGENCFKLIMNCFKSSSHGAFNTRGMINSKFKIIPSIKEKAIEWAITNNNEAFDMCSHYSEDAKTIEEFIEEKL